MTRLSVVLPVYNVEKYLAACLASVRDQDVPDLEIVCVDDGSTDGSPELLRMAAAVDHRIVVVTKPNGGLSSARNAGLRAASGDLVWFVDSDDFVAPGAAATILGTFEAWGADVVTFGARVEPASRTTPWLERTLSPRRATFDGFRPALLFDEASRPFVWRSAFTRDFLLREGLTFDEGVKFGEDQVFYFAAYPVARRVALIDDRLYHYRVARPESLMASRFAQRETMLVEHQHITRVILGLWRDHGWLAQWPADLLDWVFDFLAEDAVTSRGPLGDRLVAGLADLVGEFFPDAVLGVAAPSTRRLAAALAGGRRPALLAAFWLWRGRGNLPTTARRVLGRVVRGPGARVVGAVHRRLPGRAAAARAREEREERATEAALVGARRALEAEYAAVATDPDAPGAAS